MKTTVIIQFEVEGFHSYAQAPNVVKFLSFPHRHTFVIKCGYGVTDLNREREIFICRDRVLKGLQKKFGSPCEFKGMSCEMIATSILSKWQTEGMKWCEVWEESTGGARVEL